MVPPYDSYTHGSKLINECFCALCKETRPVHVDFLFYGF